MNLRDLHYLVALSDLRHFGRAARACHVSQPTLSMQIRKLEEEFGVPLVERAPRNVMLTPVGREIVDRARQVIHDVEQMKELARRSRDPEAGSLRLGAFPTLGPYLLPQVLPALRKRFPKMELLLSEEKSDVLVGDLHDGKLDAAFLALPLADDRLHAELLFEEAFLLAVPSGHHLEHAQHLRIGDLVDEQLLLLDDGHCLREQALDVCELAGAHEKPGFRATSLETLRQMVALGNGVTLLPELSVRPPHVQPEGLELVHFEAPAPRRQIALAWRGSSPLDGLLRNVAATVRDAVVQR